MFAMRVYITALTLGFLITVLLTTGMGVLQGTVVVCALLYLILDMIEELRDLRSLEARVSSSQDNRP